MCQNCYPLIWQILIVIINPCEQLLKQVDNSIDLFHNADWIRYSFVSMLMSLSHLAALGNIQKNETKMRPVELINTNTKEL